MALLTSIFTILMNRPRPMWSQSITLQTTTDGRNTVPIARPLVWSAKKADNNTLGFGIV